MQSSLSNYIYAEHFHHPKKNSQWKNRRKEGKKRKRGIERRKERTRKGNYTERTSFKSEKNAYKNKY